MGLSGGQGGGFHGGDEFLAAVAGQQVITALRAAVEDRGNRLQVVGVPAPGADRMRQADGGRWDAIARSETSPQLVCSITPGSEK